MRFSPLIVEHFSNPRASGSIENADVRAFIGNPVCGDQMLITASVIDGVVTDARFLAYGCAASLGTASILTSWLPGQAVADLTEVDEAQVVSMVGGLAPDQRHCATLGAAVLHRVAANARNGVNDKGPSQMFGSDGIS